MSTKTWIELPNQRYQMLKSNHCKIEDVDNHPLSSNAHNNTFTLPAASKAALFSDGEIRSSSIRGRAESILGQIRDESVSANFGFKSAAISDTPFRLLRHRESCTFKEEAPIISEVRSFIALSYCWHNDEWSSQGDDDLLSSSSHIPISATLFKALLAERVSGQDEGIWIDQLCINQDDPSEKALAIASMDVVYKMARLVAVVLEDIMLDENDEAALTALMRKYERQEIWDVDSELDLCHRLTKLLWKIYSARWFTRAWCWHELRISEDQLFLIRVESRSSGKPVSSSRVAKITAGLLHDMAHIEAHLESVRPTNYFSEAKKRYGSRRTQFNNHMLLKLRRPAAWANYGSNDPLRVPSYMKAFAEVFQFGASVITDKLSIVLNILGCGLYFKGQPLMTENKCCYTFYHLALAAGDPTALTVCGHRLVSEALWMRWPRGADVAEAFRHGTEHLRLAHTPRFDSEKISLDMIILGSSDSLHRAKEVQRSKAETALLLCSEFFPIETPQIFDAVKHEGSDLDYGRRFCVDLLACALECGRNWIIDSFRLKFPEPDPEFEAGISFICENDLVDWECGPDSQELLFSVFSLLDPLLGLWLDQGSAPVGWVPAWLETSGELSDRMLLLCPPPAEQDVFHVAIPGLLLRPEYDFLKRAWLVRQGKVGSSAVDDGKGNSDGWLIEGKTCSFGRVDFTGMEHSEMLYRHQYIWG